MMQTNLYQPPQAKLSRNPDINKVAKTKKPSVLLVVSTSVIVLVNILLAFFVAFLNGAMHINSDIVGFVIDRVFFLPTLMVLLFQVGKRFRNIASQTRIIFWASFIVFIILLVQILSKLAGYVA